MTCPTCTGRPILDTVAHYGWCDVVGGPGYAPHSLRGMQDALRQGLAEQARLAAEQAAREAEEAQRQKSNNGWVKYNGDQRSYEHLRDQFQQQLDETVRRFERAPRREALPVSRTTEAGVITRPGRELPKYWRQIATTLVDQEGWAYRYKRKGGNHPRLVPPDGGLGVALPTTVTEGHAGHRASYLTALKRAGARLEGVA